MFYLIDKKPGITSFAAIREFAKKNQIQKIGHTGTLDPLATGLLLIATDEDTPFINYIDKGSKTYITTMKFGLKSDSYDIDGNIENIGCDHDHKIADISHILKTKFSGKISQVPPIFSAKKINGKRSYDLAREGKEVVLQPQEIEIFNSKIIKWEKETKELEIEYTVSRGTYIRSLIHDLSKELKCSAIMTKLDRTAIGILTRENINKEINVFDILDLEEYKIDKNNLELLAKGIKLKVLPEKSIENKLYALSYQGILFGIGVIQDKKLRSKKLIGKKIDILLKE